MLTILSLMNDIWVIITVIFSVIIPLVIFMFALRPWVRDSARNAVSGLGERVATIEGQLKTLIEQNKLFIDAYIKSQKIGNPDEEEGILLTKLRNDTITKDEAIQLQQIMNERRLAAESENDFLKVILIIGILGLIAFALSRSG